MTVTYEDVASTLAPDIREAIEIAAPCAGGFEHLWDTVYLARSWIPTDAWRCVHCDVVAHTRPVPPVNRPEALLSATQLLEML